MSTNQIQLYSSRSAIETGQRCKRKRFFQYHYPNQDGKLIGIQLSLPNWDLAIGTVIHKGIQVALDFIKKNENAQVLIPFEAITESSVKTTIYSFQELFKDFKFKSPESEIYSDNLSLVEGLIRLYCKTELPFIAKTYNIIFTEKELTLKFSNSILFQGTSDALLEKKDNGDLINYSIKTLKKLWNKSQNSFKTDLQGLTETILIQEWINEYNNQIQLASNHIGSLLEYPSFIKGDNLSKMDVFLNSKKKRK